MDIIFLLTAGILALAVLYFKARRIFAAVRSDSEKSPCSCSSCSKSCAVREISSPAGESIRK